MEIVKGILVVLHLLCFGAMLGITIAQFKPAAKGKGVIPNGLIHCAWGLLITGAGLIGTVYAAGGAPNNLKIAVKLLVLIAIIVLLFVLKKKQPLKPAGLGAVAALLVVNVALAVLWA